MTPLVLLFLLAFLVSVDARILGPVLPSIATSLGDTPGAVGLAMTTYSLSYGTGQLVYGPLSDRLGRIAVVRAAGIGFSLCTVLSALTITRWQFVAARLLAGAFAGAVIPLTLVFIGDTVEYTRRQIVIARFSVLTSMALAFSAAIGGTIAYFVSWRLMLIGYALLALVPVGLMWRAAVAPGVVKPERASFLDFLCDVRALRVYVCVCLEGFFMWGTVTYLGAFGVQRHGLTQLAVGLIIALIGVGTMTGGLCMGQIRRRVSEGQLAGAGGAIMATAFLLLIPRWPWPFFAAAMLLLGLGLVGLHTTLQTRGTEISPTARGKAFSLFAFTLFLGIAVGTGVLGRVVDAGRWTLLFALSATGLALIGLATALPLPRRGC